MESIEKAIYDEAGVFTVEFVGDGGDVVSVRMSKQGDDTMTKVTAQSRARQMLADVIATDVKRLVAEQPKHNSDPTVLAEDGQSPAAVSLNQEREAARSSTHDQLDEGLESSFPASDPVSVATSTISGSGPSTSEK